MLVPLLDHNMTYSTYSLSNLIYREEPMQIDEEEDDDDDDEDYNNKSTKKSKTTPKKTSKNRSPKRVNSSSKSPIQKVLSSRATSTKNNTAIFKLLFSPSRRVGVGAGTNGGDGKMKNNNKQNKSVQNALQLLHTKIMNLNTTTTKQGKKRLGESLFMSILETSCSKKQKQPLLKKKSFVASTTTTCPSDEMHYSQPTSTYTEDLRQIACELIHEYNKTNNPHVMHIQLLNLLFLSIGGTSKTMLVSENEDGMDGDEEDEDDDVANDEQDIKKNEDNIKNGQIVDNLEDLDVTDWSEIVTNVVLDTRNTPLECIPFCADPHGALHWNAMQILQQQQQQTDGRGEEKQLHAVSERDVVVKKANINMILAVKTYRSIFEEFWYILGTVALVEGGMSNKQDDISDNDDDNEDTDDEEEEISPSSKKRQRKRTKEKSKTKRARKTPSTSATTRFDTEIVTNILSRINEIIAMGQPDIRAVATSAAQFLLRAVVDKTSLVQERLITAKRQHAAATKKGNGSGAKVKSLQHQIDSLERTLNDLESVVENFFIRVIFMYRYRDSNMYIRASCIETLGHFLLIKPDFFLKDKFLKYFGWMMSDKAECVRIAALSSLLAPFQIIDSESIKDQKIAKNINLSEMDRVIGKFLPRIADCVFDVQESVQEVAVKMMLTLLRHEFLEEVEDEEGNVENPLPDKTWEQINLMALAPDTSPIVRRDALYFIMEQLEDFDEGKEDEDDIEEMSDSDSLYSKQKSVKRRNSFSTNISDRKLAQRLDAIASWASHALSSGKIPIQKVRIHLVDYLVHSLRAMPQHKSIVTSWSAMLRAIKDDNIAMTSQGTAAGDKANVAKQRVLVQMLICAAKAEVESVDPDYLHTNVDSDVVDLLKKKLIEEAKEENCPPTKRARASSNLQHENLSIALMKALPDLLVQFKSDSAIIESLVSLPRYFSELENLSSFAVETYTFCSPLTFVNSHLGIESSSEKERFCWNDEESD
jgi:cohesin complex subunit SA-1/2